jgi:hypothetical protein
MMAAAVTTIGHTDVVTVKLLFSQHLDKPHFKNKSTERKEVEAQKLCQPRNKR